MRCFNDTLKLGSIALRDNASQRPARLRLPSGSHRCIRTTISQQSALTHPNSEQAPLGTTTKPSWTLTATVPKLRIKSTSR